ncbi:MAG TPA: DUF1648 domain-containing protein [Beutenbergiaceae bacterium]|nr:DUF1648 domain-containing protein [Beutenbergiaceae bacterium]
MTTDRTNRSPLADRSPLPHRGRALVLGVVLPLIMLAGATALFLLWQDRMPQEVVLHWGTSGPTRFGSPTEHLLGVLIIAGLTLLITGVLSLALGRSAMARRMTVGTSAGIAAFYAGLLLATGYAHLDATDPSQVPAPGDGLALAAVAALAIGAAAAMAAGADPDQPAQRAVPADAARLELPADAAAVWIKQTQYTTRWIPVTIVVATVVPGVVLALVTDAWWLASLFALIALSLVAFGSFQIRVDASGLTARGVVGWPRQHVPLNEVERADVVHIDPFGEFGGWGLRTSVDGRTGVVTRKGEAIQVQRTGGRTFVATVDDAERGAALLNTLAERNSPGHRER